MLFLLSTLWSYVIYRFNWFKDYGSSRKHQVKFFGIRLDTWEYRQSWTEFKTAALEKQIYIVAAKKTKTKTTKQLIESTNYLKAIYGKNPIALGDRHSVSSLSLVPTKGNNQ